jgi:hypothetical protein
MNKENVEVKEDKGKNNHILLTSSLLMPFLSIHFSLCYFMSSSSKQALQAQHLAVKQKCVAVNHKRKTLLTCQHEDCLT